MYGQEEGVQKHNVYRGGGPILCTLPQINENGTAHLCIFALEAFYVHLRFAIGTQSPASSF